jgi:hypothetical protein
MCNHVLVDPSWFPIKYRDQYDSRDDKKPALPQTSMVLKEDAILFGIIHFKGTKHVLLDYLVIR